MIITEPLAPEVWHALRAQNVGASEIAALWNAQPDYAMSRFTLWHVKAGRVPPPEVPGERPRWGLRLEEAIALAAQEQAGWSSISKIHYATDDTTPGLGCTPDYIIDAPGPTDEGCDGPGLLECKNVDWMIAKRSWTDAEPPIHILLQLQTQMACTGCAWGVVAGLVGGNDLRIYPYRARPKLIAEIRKRVAEFWQSIREGREPAVDGSDGASYVLCALYPEVEDDAVDLTGDNEFAVLCPEFLTVSAEQREIKRKYAKLRNQLVAKLMGRKRAFGSGFAASLAISAAKEPSIITPEMVGQEIPGKEEVRRLIVKEKEISV